MKKMYFIILLLTMMFMPFKVFAVGGFNVSSTSVNMYLGETKTITINTNNVVGRLDITSSNVGVASVSSNSLFIQNLGSSEKITITGNSVGTATISVIASADFATMDEEILEGQTKTITVNVMTKISGSQSQQSENNLSNNNNIKSISVEGYELVKVDNNNYTLTVSNDVTNINVNAVSEDSKAKVSGIGEKELQVGENNIELLVTSESGKQNKIIIKVTRKEGYYLDDLDSILNNEKISDVDIIIDTDSKITKEQLDKIKNSNKTIRLNYYNEDKKIIYSWIIIGSEIKDTEEFLTTILYTSNNIKDIYKLSNYADGLYVNFKHSGIFPKGLKVKLYVGDKYDNDDVVKLYYYDVNNNKLEKVKDEVKVLGGYIEFDLEYLSEYFITMSTIGDIVHVEESKSNIFLIFTIIELIVIVGLSVFIVINFKPTKSNIDIN